MRTRASLRRAQHAARVGRRTRDLSGPAVAAIYEFRDRYVAEAGGDVIVWRNEAAIAARANPFDLGTLLKTDGLLTGLRHQSVRRIPLAQRIAEGEDPLLRG